MIRKWGNKTCATFSIKRINIYPGDSDNGQYISFTERQVLFVGSLEVVLGYTLCASRPWCLQSTGQRKATLTAVMYEVLDYGICDRQDATHSNRLKKKKKSDKTVRGLLKFCFTTPLQSNSVINFTAS